MKVPSHGHYFDAIIIMLVKMMVITINTIIIIMMRMSTTLIIFFFSVFLLLKLTEETHCGCSDGECWLQGGATWGQSHQSIVLPIINII